MNVRNAITTYNNMEKKGRERKKKEIMEIRKWDENKKKEAENKGNEYH